MMEKREWSTKDEYYISGCAASKFGRIWVVGKECSPDGSACTRK